MEFIKKPVKVHAIQFTNESRHQCLQWINDNGGRAYEEDYGNALSIITREGAMRANVGDWIIQGVQGEFYPCKPDIFAQTYDPVNQGGGRTVRDKVNDQARGHDSSID